MHVNRSECREWRAVQVVCTTPAARLSFLTTCLPTRSLGGRWYFADVPVAFGAGVSDGVEVGIRVTEALDGTLRAVPAVVRSLLQRSGAVGGLITHAPRVLEPALFPRGRMPLWFPTALAAGSVRAVRALRRLPPSSPGGMTSSEVGREVERLFRTLIPDPTWRCSALGWCAQWLESPAAGRAATHPEPGNGAGAREWLPSRREYVAAVVARLAHIHVVRLWGPSAARRAGEERALLLDLAAKLRCHPGRGHQRGRDRCPTSEDPCR